jgi:hypothetical protein
MVCSTERPLPDTMWPSSRALPSPPVRMRRLMTAPLPMPVPSVTSRKLSGMGRPEK